MSPKKVVIILIGLGFVVAASIFLLNGIINGQPAFLNNCSEAKVRHLTNIPKGSVYYRAELDKNHDGIACQS